MFSNCKIEKQINDTVANDGLRHRTRTFSQNHSLKQAVKVRNVPWPEISSTATAVVEAATAEGGDVISNSIENGGLFFTSFADFFVPASEVDQSWSGCFVAPCCWDQSMLGRCLFQRL